MEPRELFLRLGIVTALGFLVGLQRESEQNRLAGIRTIPMIAMLGALCGMMGVWAVAGGFLALAGVLAVAIMRVAPDEHRHPGLTTLIAALLMYALGASTLTGGPLAVPVVLGGGLAVLLHARQALHAWVGRIGGDDLRAVFRFVLISLVILPVLPGTPLDPWGAVSPREVWLMVVLIVGIGLGGYVLLKLFGARAGTLLGGVLGGLVSSTATTVSFARRVRSDPQLAGLAAVVVMIASTIANLRLVALAAAVAPVQARTIAPPLLTLAAIMAAITAVAFLGTRGRTGSPVAHGNPAEIRPALIFAGLYAVIALAVAASRSWFGESVLYPVAAISGLTDLDAITLTAARLCTRPETPLASEVAWRMIMVGTLANLAFKGAAAWVLGGRALGWRVALLFGLSALGGVGLLVL